MICTKCGHDNAAKSHAVDPWCMYQVQGGKVVNQLFLPHEIPEGWYDSPKAAKAAVEPKKAESPVFAKPEEEAPKKVDGRTKAAKQMKAQNDYSSGSDQ